MMSTFELVSVVSLVLNFTMMLLAAWIRADLSGMKVYMHEKFVTKDLLAQILHGKNTLDE